MHDMDILLKIKDFLLIFTSIFYEALPFIVLGAIIAGLLEEFLPSKLLGKIFPKKAAMGVFAGGFLGLVFPMCECGIIPIMRRLLRKGLPLSSCVAYLLAGPVINPIVLFSTYMAFSGMEDTLLADGRSQWGASPMTFARAISAYLVAVGTGLIIHLLYPDPKTVLVEGISQTLDSDEEKKPKGLWSRLDRITGVAVHDFLDIAFFLTIGALLSAGIRIFLTQEEISGLSDTWPILSIALMMLVGFVLCLCSEADAFIAAAFVKMIPAAKLGFLVFGPMMDLKLLLMYTRIFKPKLIATILTAVAIQVLVYMLITHAFWLRNSNPQVQTANPTISVSQEVNQTP
jgi:uncharacterized membrane protein YraQ (UPF0718 family)